MAATLVLAAWEPEIAPLRRLARAVAPERLVLGTVGVGAVDAAVDTRHSSLAMATVPFAAVARPRG